MRWMAMFFILTPLAVQAATEELNVTIASGSVEPVVYRYPLDQERREIDLRQSGRYHVAFKDTATKKVICREAQYKTGLSLTLKPLPKEDGAAQKVEVIGLVTKLAGVKDGERFSCGINQEVSLSHQDFSDTVVVEENRTKAIVIDGVYTVILKIQ
ncbi:hypothetical protein ACQYZY_26990 [Pseudomonas aeruginosa]|jgi:hypothetical protein|uniref:hypothetical protein n=1 Tax=Pseudomonas aeruginosa TaxID=287 RepID=UPI001A2779DA|nr:hypothetical protein [Pseudomonas aeruginosa]EKV0397871.1 hypothetical protein [Pseudomonas aeruginosa]EKV3012852.1 hypothetical protein [Pseudomonas aeruginosa]MBH4318537.1 hypothetical protein [Pseudomonas aeruginosa]MBH8701108.1 hypothetical protein [Pseudomonas aeruginosa]WBM10781.1 hypothetical protein M1V28_32690 [Pseudomonas aeruginosa]